MIKLLILSYIISSCTPIQQDLKQPFNYKLIILYDQLLNNKQPEYITNLKGLELLEEVNKYVNNRIKYNKEINIDVWQSPHITEKLKTGDCEDLALYKYEILKQNNIDPKDMSILITKISNNLYHAVLEVKLNNKLHYLDIYSDTIIDNYTGEILFKVNPYVTKANIIIQP